MMSIVRSQLSNNTMRTVVNNIKVVGVQQVLLHTRIMEVSRTKLRELGVDWGTALDNGFFVSAPGRI